MLGFLLPAFIVGLGQAGELSAQVSGDYLRASSTATGTGVGSPETIVAQEAGMRLRGELSELDDRFQLLVDYRGREPLPGDLQTTTIRLLYTGKVRYHLIEDRWSAELGRFIAPSVVLLPVDGLSSEWRPGSASRLTLFAGRRAINTSRRNIALSRFLPAGGASLVRSVPRFHLQAQAAYAVDEAIFGAGAGSEHVEEYGALNAMINAMAIPGSRLQLGGYTTFVQQASYVLGPTWKDATVTVEALDLWSGLVWVDYEPREWLQLEYDLLAQQVGVYAAGLATDDGVAALEEPNHVDNRVRLGFRPGELGWIRGDFRYRIRAEGSELRAGLRVDSEPIGPIYTRLYGAVDNGLGAAFIGSALIGHQRDIIDLQGGISHIERSAAPWSSRSVEGESGEDLSPFVFEAQSVAFLRAFYTDKRWFSGLDIERNLKDSELRLMLQVGALTERSW